MKQLLNTLFMQATCIRNDRQLSITSTVVLISTIFLTVTSCFYRTIELNPTDKSLIPYRQTTKLVFINTSGARDTILLIRRLPESTNIDFFIDRKLDKTRDKKKPYFESYSTEISLNKTIGNIETNQDFIKYDPLMFGFYKSQYDSLISMYFSIDGRWAGSISFDTVKTSTLTTSNTTYDDIFIIDNHSHELFRIKRIFWSISSGLVRIEEKDAEQWTLLNKIQLK